MEILLNDFAEPDCDDMFVESLVWLDEALKAGRSVSAADLPFTLSDAQRETWIAAKHSLEQLREFSSPTQRWVSVPEHVGRFAIERVIGIGGFGVVYRARDPQLNRVVALKVPRPQTLFSADVRERFLREARAASQLDHPHIVAIHEAGNVGDVPYIAYAYCVGPSLAGWLREHPGPMSPGVAAEVLVALTSAVAYGHERGIIHRDIKPGNVLLIPQNQGTSESFAFVPRLSDYGLAKLIETDLVETRSSQMLGTPLYMAPELLQQVTRAEAGSAVDIYSLGSVLYELLTGRPPFVADTPWEVLLQVRDREPTHPSVVQPRVPHDLETICLKCLEKNPLRRYASATALLSDLQRFRDGRPIQAVPISRLERSRRWCVRHPALSLLSGTVLTLLVGLLAGLLMHLATVSRHHREIVGKNDELAGQVQKLEAAVSDADLARRNAESSTDQARMMAYVSDIERAAGCWERKDFRDLARILRPYREEALLQPYREFTWSYLQAQSQAKGQRLSTDRQACWTVRFAPHGQCFVSAGSASLVQVFSYPDGKLLNEWVTDQSEVNCVAFTPDGGQLATAGDDGTVKLWNLQSSLCVRTWDVFSNRQVYGVEFTPNGGTLAVCGNGPDVILIDALTGVMQSVTTSARTLEGLAMSPDGRTLAVATFFRTVLLVDLETRTVRTELPLTEKRPLSVAYSADGRWLVGASNDGRLQVWDTADDRVVAQFKRPDAIRAVAFAADNHLACADGGGVITSLRWNPPTVGGLSGTLQPLRVWHGHDSSAQTLAFAPDGQSVVTGSRGQEVVLWSATPQERHRQLAAPSPKSGWSTAQVLALGTSNRIWRATPQGLEEWTLSSSPSRRAWSLGRELNSVSVQGATIAVGTNDGRVGVFPGGDPESVLWCPLSDRDEVAAVALLSDGLRGLAWTPLKELVLFNRVVGTSLQRIAKVQRLAVSPDDAVILIHPENSNDLLVLNGSTLAEERRLRGHSGSVLEIAFSPDASLAVSIDVERTAIVWDRKTWTVRHVLSGFSSIPNAIAFSPDGQTLAIGQERGQISLWHLPTGRPLINLPLPDGFFIDLQFTQDGQHLVAESSERALITYDAVPSAFVGDGAGVERTAGE